ncbi:hypothetical protein [Cupriavidus sp. SK-4]|uniref:hypothetical protein n=1 Tax=Cupriavidus sp. SK-4 TaxID=574750 RepID=UPI001F399D0C|nr:hypothetical protein [Cupriavidus sp. SK-4]
MLLAQQVFGGIDAVVDDAHLVASAGQAGFDAAGNLAVVLDQQDTHGGSSGRKLGMAGGKASWRTREVRACRRLY